MGDAVADAAPRSLPGAAYLPLIGVGQLTGATARGRPEAAIRAVRPRREGAPACYTAPVTELTAWSRSRCDSGTVPLR